MSTSRELRDFTIADLENLKIDAKGRFCWHNRPLAVRDLMSGTEKGIAIIVTVSTVIAALASSVGSAIAVLNYLSG